MRLRRDLRQRASQQRLRLDAVAEFDRLGIGASDHGHRALRPRQFLGALQPADPRRRRIRDDRCDLRRAAHRRLPSRNPDGHLLRLRPEPVGIARALSRSARPCREGVDRARDLCLERPLQPAALRQHLAAPGAEAASADLDPGRRLGRNSAPPKYADKFATLAREMDGIVDKGYVIIGSPDEVAEQLREVAKNLNVGHLMTLLQFGNMSKDVANYNTQLFAEKVMPQLKDVFSEWEDRWWPQPMPRAERAAPASFQPTAFAAE